MTKEQAAQMAAHCCSHGDFQDIERRMAELLLAVASAPRGPTTKTAGRTDALVSATQDVEVFRERALKAESRERRACAETVVFKMFAMKVAAQPGDHQRDALLLVETGPSTLAEGLLVELEQLRAAEAARAIGTSPQDAHVVAALDGDKT